MGDGKTTQVQGGRMDGTGTPKRAELLGLKRGIGRRLATAGTTAAAVLAFSVTALAPPASAAPGPLAGSWTSVDLDGSHQTLRIKGAGHPVYSTFYRDDFTSGVCGGPPAKLVGHGVSDGTGLTVVGTLVCLHRGNPIPGERVSLRYEYDAATDTLTDDSGVVWERAG
jgi:hypothetical protein